MKEYAQNIMSGLAKTDITGFSEHICLIPTEHLEHTLSSVEKLWVMPEAPWQRYDQLWWEWKGSLPISRLQYSEHPKEYATVRVWRTRVWSDGRMHHDRATYSFISVLEYGPSKSRSQWVEEVSSAIDRKDLCYQAMIPSVFSRDVAREVMVNKERGPIVPACSAVHNYSTGDSSRMVPGGHEEISLYYCARDKDPVIRGHWLMPWVNVLNAEGAEP